MSTHEENIGSAIATEIIGDNYSDPAFDESTENWQAERLDEALAHGLDGDGIRAMLEAAARQGYREGSAASLTRVKTAFHRLADRVENDDENTVKVPLSEILMYTDENRAKIAKMLRREAESF